MKNSLQELPNGIRHIHIQVPATMVSHCGLILNVGSRDEQDDEIGLAHFWEHMAFKGTKKRKAHHIINRMETVGGELNAYTTKEKISFYSTQLFQHTERALELLTDIVFHSVFPEKELQKERAVILEEISMYLDSPDEAIQDEMDSILFPKHPLGNNILGTPESLANFSSVSFFRFLERELSTEKIVLSTVGPQPAEQVFKLAEKHLRSIELKSKQSIRKAAPKPTLSKVVLQKPINQAHVVLAGAAPSKLDPMRVPFFLLSNYLGGAGMNAKFNVELREKQGLVYAVDANYSALTDTGSFSIYFGTENKNVKKALGIIDKVCKQLVDNPLSPKLLSQCKNQIMGQMSVAEENRNALMIVAGKSVLEKGRLESLEEVFDQINAVNAIQIQELAALYLNTQEMAQLIYEPEAD